MNFTEIIKKGSTNQEAVKAIKAQLNKITGSTLDVNNSNFGDSTEKVVKEFQKKNSLIQDASIGELTWKKLFEKTIVNVTNELSKEVLIIAKSQMGLGEATGNNDGPAVEKYLKAVGLSKGYPYCMAFLYWCFNEASKLLNRINPVPKTGGVLDCYKKAKGKYLVIDGIILPGDQFIMSFGVGKGHTGIIIEQLASGKVHTYEANTSADPKIPAEDREGGGNFERLRDLKTFKAILRYL